MDKKKFCCVDDFPVMIPYRDLEILLEVANNFERYEHTLEATRAQLAALRSQYAELVEKVGAISKMI